MAIGAQIKIAPEALSFAAHLAVAHRVPASILMQVRSNTTYESQDELSNFLIHYILIQLTELEQSRHP